MIKVRIYLLLWAMAVCCLLGTSMQAVAKSLPNKVYMFGFAASFNDSTVYFTDIQEVNGAYTDVKTKFLINRSEYSYQLRNYLKQKEVFQPTCITAYAFDHKTIEKKMAKLKKKYTVKAKNRYIVKTIGETEFKYQVVAPQDAHTVFVDAAEAEAAARKSKAARQHQPGKNEQKDE